MPIDALAQLAPRFTWTHGPRALDSEAGQEPEVLAPARPRLPVAALPHEDAASRAASGPPTPDAGYDVGRHFARLWSDSRPGETPPPLPSDLPTTPGIYPDARARDGRRVAYGETKPARRRPMLLVGASGHRYLRGEKLAQGSFGKVYVVVREDGVRLVAKIFRGPDRQAFSETYNGSGAFKPRATYVSRRREVDKERAVLDAVGAAPIDTGSGEGRWFFILPYMPASLRDLHRSLGSGDAAMTARRDLTVHALADTAARLSGAHARGILHLDIKPENMLVGEAGEVELSDWGLAARLAPGAETLRSRAGTLLFQAPEVRMRDEAQRASDVYSLGISASLLATGHNPLRLYPHACSEDDFDLARWSLGAWQSTLFDANDRLLSQEALAARAAAPSSARSNTFAQHHDRLDAWAQGLIETLVRPVSTFLLRDMLAFDARQRPQAGAVATFFSLNKNRGAHEVASVRTLVDALAPADGSVAAEAARLRAAWATLA